MKKTIFLCMMFCFMYSILSSTSQKYGDTFFISNQTDSPLLITFSFSTLLEPLPIALSVYGAKLNFRPYYIWVSRGDIADFSPLTLQPKKNRVFWDSNYRHDQYFSISAYEKFLLIAGEFSVQTLDGTVLLDLKTLKPEDFTVKEENGLKEATIIIRNNAESEPAASH